MVSNVLPMSLILDKLTVTVFGTKRLIFGSQNILICIYLPNPSILTIEHWNSFIVEANLRTVCIRLDFCYWVQDCVYKIDSI